MADIKGTYAAGTATINANTNIGFKLGLESKLKDASFSAVNGVFYLTSDTHRLFIGNSDGSVSPVNQGVINVDELPSYTNAVPGQFYYITSQNILATYNGSQWVQINPDTQVTAAELQTSAGTNSAIISTLLSQAGGTHTKQQILSNDVTIKGANDIVVTVDPATDVITITDADYSFSTTGTDNDVQFNLVRDPADGNAAVESSVKFVGADGVTIKQTDKVITIDAAQAMNSANQNSIKAAAFTNAVDADGKAISGFDLTLTRVSNATIVADARLDPVVKYGGKGGSSAKYEEGTATLSVYTVAEIDDMIKTLDRQINALTYKGLVGNNASSQASTLPTTEVKVGDVWMSDGTYNGRDAGTLFIATGTEGIDGYITGTITWTEVQNYNTDTATSVNVDNDNTIAFYNSIIDGDNPGQSTLIGSFKVSVNPEQDHPLSTEDKTNDDTKEKEVIISHNVSGYTHDALDQTKADWAAQSTADVNKSILFRSADVLGSIAVDVWGHVKSSSNAAFEVPTEVFSEDTTTSTPTVTGTAQSKMTGTFTDSLTLSKGSKTGAEISSIEMKTQISSETLTLAVDNGALKMDLMWGTF